MFAASRQVRLKKDRAQTEVRRSSRTREDAFARMLGFGEDPLTWALPAGRAGDIRVRVHIMLFIWLAVELVVLFLENRPHRDAMVALVCALPVVAFLREIARGKICRNEGRRLETVVIWPLGGLSSTSPRMRSEAGWRAVFAEVGGLVCSLVLMPVFAAGFILAGGDWLHLEITPVYLDTAAAGFVSASQGNGASAWVRIAMWGLYHGNVLILLTNLVLPLYPFDAARMLRARQERSVGDWAAAAFTAKFAYLTAIVLLLVGAVTDNGRMMCVAMLGGALTWLELRRAAFLRESPSEVFAPVDSHLDSSVEDPEFTLDRVLAKVHAGGLEGLTDDEKAFLKEATERRRRE